MSSFIGHAITGAAIYCAASHSPKKEWLWLGWLTTLAVLPDAEYAYLWLFGKKFIAVRFTHSLAFCAFLTAVTLLALMALRHADWPKTMQAAAAALSHLMLDLLVGVSSKAIFWPFMARGVKLPFGILPSAGRLDPLNPALYRNLLIELSILLPLYSLLLFHEKIRQSPRRRSLMIGHLLIFVPAALIGLALRR